MDQKHEQPIIMTITGDVGSGKSMLADALVKQFHANRYSTGTVQRQLAEKMGISTLELNKRAETDPSIDEKIDSVFKSLEDTPGNLIVDSRMAWHFLPSSFKMKLEVHPLISAHRVCGDTLRIGEGYTSIEEARDRLTARKSSERERFKRYYNADIEDQSNYNLIIETTRTKPEYVQKLATSCIQGFMQDQDSHRFWISPLSLFPTQSLNETDQKLVSEIQEKNKDLDQWTLDLPEVYKDSDGFFYLNGGHDLVAAAILANKPLIPVTLLNTDHIPALDLSIIQNWQDSLKIEYSPLP